jgi:DNA-binding GntR family transcriptional regulator
MDSAEGPASRAATGLRRRIMLNELPPGSVLTELGLATDLG